jgi:hypothetical protein
VMISTQSVGLVIDTVVCLTLDKWETVSGQFGGYLTARYYTMAFPQNTLELVDWQRRYRRTPFTEDRLSPIAAGSVRTSAVAATISVGANTPHKLLRKSS